MQIAVFAQRMAANLLGAMGVLALLLAAIGLYGVMAYAVSQRTQEMGIRLALGASPGSLLGMVVGQGMRLTTIGLAIGLALALGAFGSIGAVRSLLPGISPLDPITFVDGADRARIDRAAGELDSRAPSGQSRSAGRAAIRIVECMT